MTSPTIQRIVLAALLLCTLAAARPQEPTAVSLRLRDVPVTQAYEMLGKQAGVTIRYGWGQPRDDQRISATLIHEPFWTAMAKIGKAADMQMTYVRREPTREVWVSNVAVMSTNLPVGNSVDGAFIGTIYDNVDQALRRSKPDPTKKYASRITIGFRAEPKIKPMLLHSIQINEFVDETGRPIEHKLMYKAVTFYDGSALTLIHLPERSWPRRIGRLRLNAKVLASADTKLAEIVNLMQDSPPSVSVGGFRIEAATKTGKRGRMITLNMTRETTVSPDWLRPASRLELLEPIVLDSAGRKLMLHTYDRDWFGRMCRLQLEAEVPKPRPSEPVFGQPHKLVMEIPTDVVEYEVKLAFDDVKLY